MSARRPSSRPAAHGGGRAGPAALLAAALAALSCGAPPPWSVTEPLEETRRRTPQGEVQGGAGRYQSHAWLGIPYAEPPVGDLRWRAPRPAPTWSSPLAAHRFGPECPQLANLLGGHEGAKKGELRGTEDCLYLNVWAPRFSAAQVPRGDARLPVMVWIHGGGNSLGSARTYEGGRLSVDQNVVVVTVQYRLGPLGYFRHSSLRSGAQDAAEASGNFATLDLVQSLVWVRDNISAFGGDPGNVTVFGESAGGMNVYGLLLAPQAKGLFHRAIVQSGALSHTTTDEAERFADDAQPGHARSSGEVLLALLVAQGQADGRAAAQQRLAAMSDDEVAHFLRGLTVAQLFAPYVASARMGMLDMPLVFGDGAVLPKEDWLSRFSRPDGWNRVPVMVGSNRDEVKLFFALDPRRVRRLFGVLPRFRDEPSYLAAAEAGSRTWKAAAVDEPAQAMRRSGAEAVYAYRFDWRGEPKVLGSDLSKLVGAAHGLEIPFVFGHFELGGRMGRQLFPPSTEACREELSAAMRSYWGQLARSGTPGRGRDGRLPRWAPWGEGPEAGPSFMLLDQPCESGIRASSSAESRARIIADVDADPRLASQKERCRVFHDLAAWTHGMSRAEYATAGKAGCADFPYEGYPWGE